MRVKSITLIGLTDPHKIGLTPWEISAITNFIFVVSYPDKICWILVLDKPLKYNSSTAW